MNWFMIRLLQNINNRMKYLFWINEKFFVQKHSIKKNIEIAITINSAAPELTNNPIGNTETKKNNNFLILIFLFVIFIEQKFYKRH